MAWENLSKCISLPVGADLRAFQFCFVTIDSDGKVIAAGDGGDAVGILENNPDAGQVANLMTGPGGISKMKTGGPVLPGQWIASDSSGRAVAASTGDRVLGIAIESNGGEAGVVIPVLFQPRTDKL